MASEGTSVSDVLRSTATVPIIIVVFISIALYNVLELFVLTFGTFRKYRGLYFWSVLVATTGVAFNAVGYLLKHLALTTEGNVYATIIIIGWCTMVTGQSVVLYSRLHILLQNRKQLRAVLIMIITNAIWLHIPVIVLVYGSNSTNPRPFIQPYSIYEKIQLTVFFVQETIISAIYLWKTARVLQLEKSIGNNRTHRIMNHLIYVNIIIILLDISILVLEFANKYNIQTAWKPFVYSVKLKMEFSILNRLVGMVKGPTSGGSYGRSGAHPSTKGVALETFRGDRHQQTRTNNQDLDTGYSVHIGVGKGHETGRYGNSSVLKTTEITIHTDGSQKGVEGDDLSLDGKSGLTGESTAGEGRDKGCTSSSSSEIQFARSQA